MGETLTAESNEVRRRSRQQRLRRQRLLSAAAGRRGRRPRDRTRTHPRRLEQQPVAAGGTRAGDRLGERPVNARQRRARSHLPGGRHPGEALRALANPRREVFIRYLPQGVPAGAKTGYLTVATYPYPNALRAIRGLANSPGTRSIALPRGGLAVVDPSHPTNIHLAYPRSNYEVEVFAPTAAQARRVVTSGKVSSVAAGRR